VRFLKQKSDVTKTNKLETTHFQQVQQHIKTLYINSSGEYKSKKITE
jgi:hypothetical protein